MNLTEFEHERLLNFFPEPMLIAEVSGRVYRANQAARRMLDLPVENADLTRRIADSPDRLLSFLRRSAGSTSVTMQSFRVTGADGEASIARFHGARLGETAEGLPLVMVRVAKGGPVEFSILAAKVRELDAELHRRLHVQAVLEEAVQDRDTLLRELQHRVKNNLQLVLSMISAAQRETPAAEAQGSLSTLQRRVLAMASVQQLMYGSEELSAIRGDEFIRQLCAEISQTFEAPVALTINAPQFALPHDIASPIALIINELITNSYKHGRSEQALSIEVAVEQSEERLLLMVCDNGPGFPEPISEGRRMSGLNLVRGLCRQIGATVRFENKNGARVFVGVPIVEDEESRISGGVQNASSGSTDAVVASALPDQRGAV